MPFIFKMSFVVYFLVFQIYLPIEGFQSISPFVKFSQNIGVNIDPCVKFTICRDISCCLKKQKSSTPHCLHHAAEKTKIYTCVHNDGKSLSHSHLIRLLIFMWSLYLLIAINSSLFWWIYVIDRWLWFCLSFFF